MKNKFVAYIIEDKCIGCTQCIQACPVDAILGAAKLMHTVIESECIGCELCLPPCPVDCIELRPMQHTPKKSHTMRRIEIKKQRAQTKEKKLEQQTTKQTPKELIFQLTQRLKKS